MADPDSETQIYLRKRTAFRGSFKCPLHALRPEAIDVRPRQTDPKNIARLVGIFKSNQCRRLEPENHVIALVADDALRSWIAQVGGAARLAVQDAEPIMLRPTVPLVYLQGLHRLEAAKRFLHPDDQWWVVDLYSNGKGSRSEMEESAHNGQS